MANQRFKVLVVILLGFSVAHARLAQAPKKVPPPPQKIVREGIAVEFTIESSGNTQAGELLRIIRVNRSAGFTHQPGSI